MQRGHNNARISRTHQGGPNRGRGLTRIDGFDEEYMGDVLLFIDRLEADIRALDQSIVDGSYRFEQKDLPFMAIVNQVDSALLPFKSLLARINQTH